jgi:hypothetical protein
MSRLQFFTHHKCASKWLERYLKEVAFINGYSYSSTHYSSIHLPASDHITAYVNASYAMAVGLGGGGIHIIRNPLDILVSAYHSHLTTHSVLDWPELARQRSILQKSDEVSGYFLTLAFIERDDFFNGAVGPLHAYRHWDFSDSAFQTLRMEDVVKDLDGALGAAIRSRLFHCRLPVGQQHSFEAIAGRPYGTTDEASHYRSGQPDQWRDALPTPVVRYVQTHYRELLEAFYPESLA